MIIELVAEETMVIWLEVSVTRLSSACEVLTWMGEGFTTVMNPWRTSSFVATRGLALLAHTIFTLVPFEWRDINAFQSRTSVTRFQRSFRSCGSLAEETSEEMSSSFRQNSSWYPYIPFPTSCSLSNIPRISTRYYERVTQTE